MSELLATLLSGIGAGAQQYGKGLGDRAMANQEEKKAMQNKLRMKQIQDGMDYEKQRAIIAATRPELLEVYDRSTNQAGILRPLDDSDLKMLDSHVTARKAQEQLDAMSVNPQTQSAMGNTARQGGLDSPLGVTPQTPSAQQAYQMDYSTFAEPAQQEANTQMQSDNPPSMNRRGMSGDNPGASLATAVDIYMKKKMQAESNRNILSAKNAKEAATIKGTEKEDAGATFTQQELWDRYQTFLRGKQTDYEQAQRAYDQELARFNTAEARMAKDPSYTNPYKEPNPPLRPTELTSFDADPQTSFLSWGQRQSNMLGEVGGKVRGVNQSKPGSRPAPKRETRKKKTFKDGSFLWVNPDGSYSKE